MPEAILQRRWTSGDHPVEQVLIKWSLMPPSLATWESYEPLHQQFPRAPAWGQAGSEDGGNVNTVPDPATAPDAPSSAPKAVSKSRPARERRPNPFVAGPEWM